MSEHDAAWLQAARMEALEAEIRRLHAIEDALTASQAEHEALHANFITLGMANEVYKNELREENRQLREVLGEFVADDAAGHIEHEDGYMECQYCDGQGTYDWTSKTYTYAHTAGCPVAVARALLTPPAAQIDWIALQQRILGKRWHPIGGDRWQHEETGRIVEMETPAAPEADTP